MVHGYAVHVCVKVSKVRLIKIFKQFISASSLSYECFLIFNANKSPYFNHATLLDAVLGNWSLQNTTITTFIVILITTLMLRLRRKSKFKYFLQVIF
jgi:hypothetical protein